MRRSALWILALAAVVLLVAACDSDGSSPSGTPTPSPAPAADASPSPSPTAAAVRLLEPVAPVLAHRMLAPGEAAGETALLFLDSAARTIEEWTPLSPAKGHPGLEASPDGAIIRYIDGAGTPYLVVRATGQAYRDTGANVDLRSAAGSLALAWPAAGDAHWTGAVADLVSGTLRPLPLEFRSQEDVQSLLAPGGRVLVHIGGALAMVDLVSASVAPFVTAGLPGAFLIEARPAGDGFLVRATPGQASPATMDWYGWDGQPRARGLPAGLLSPDGRLVAVAEPLTRWRVAGMGEYPVVTATIIIDAGDRQPVARVLGASPRGWLADSSGMLFGGAGASTHVLTLGGEELASFPFPGFMRPGPTPSPADGSLIGTADGVTGLGGSTLPAPPHPDRSWVLQARWLTDGRTFVMSIAVPPGKDGGWAGEVLPMRFERPAHSGVPGVRVAAGGDCLNLRAMPSPAAGVVRCLPDGIAAQVTEVPDPLYDPQYDKDGAGPQPYGGVMDATYAPWLHIALDDGTAGWVSPAYLDWAP